MKRSVLRITLLLLAFCLATILAGWWCLPVLGLIWGGISEKVERPVATAAAGAAGGWALLLIWDAFRGPVLELASTVGEVLSLPGPMVLGLSLLFPAAVAGSCTLLAYEIKVLARNHRSE